MAAGGASVVGPVSVLPASRSEAAAVAASLHGSVYVSAAAAKGKKKSSSAAGKKKRKTAGAGKAAKKGKAAAAGTAAQSGAVERRYKKMTQVQHILKRPDTYIGAVEPVKQNVWVYDDAVGEIIKKPVRLLACRLWRLFALP